jgi:hypothetical protein
METWRLLVSTGALILVWAVVVTLAGEPPGPGAVALATVLGGAGIYASERVMDRYVKPYAEQEE